MENQLRTPFDYFWTLPPIQDAVALELSRIELLHLIQTSRTLHHAFIPFLWKEVVLDLSSSSLFFASTAQIRHRSFVKTLEFEDYNAPELTDYFNYFGPLPNLTHLVFGFSARSSLDLQDKTPEVIAVTASHSTLESLYIWQHVVTVEFVAGFRIMMAKFVQLKELDLHLGSRVTCQDIAVLLEACSGSGLEKLTLKAQKGVHTLEPFSKGLERVCFGENRIKRLNLWIEGPWTDFLIVRFLKASPDLKQLSWITTLESKGFREEDLYHVFTSCCPRLRDLRFGKRGIDSGRLSKVISACSPLFKLGVHVPATHGSIVQVITACHGSMLTELNLSDYGFLPEELFSVTSSCPLLETLRIGVDWVFDQADGEEMLSRMENKPWACNHLLNLVFTFWPSRSYPDLIQEKGFKVLYHQIGLLTALEGLTFSTVEGNRSLSESLVKEMHHLAGLTRLSRFYFSDCEAFPLTEEHLWRMVDQWKGLERFGGLKGVWETMPARKVVEVIRARDSGMIASI